MPKRRQRRPAFRPPRGEARNRSADQAVITAGARRLLATRDARSLQSLVVDLRSVLEEADRIANDQPSPEALANFRRATRELAEAECALSLSEEAA